MTALHGAAVGAAPDVRAPLPWLASFRGCGMTCGYCWAVMYDLHTCSLVKDHEGRVHECVCGASVLLSGGAA